MADQHDVLDDSAAVLPFPANTPVAPYYAVIFSSTRTDGDNEIRVMNRHIRLIRAMHAQHAE